MRCTSVACIVDNRDRLLHPTALYTLTSKISSITAPSSTTSPPLAACIANVYPEVSCTFSCTRMSSSRIWQCKRSAKADTGTELRVFRVLSRISVQADLQRLHCNDLRSWFHNLNPTVAAESAMNREIEFALLKGARERCAEWQERMPTGQHEGHSTDDNYMRVSTRR